MLLKSKFDIAILCIFLVLSTWIMYKSFGYSSQLSQWRMARNEIGDFGLHLSLIRSFSLGNNIPVESPFYPGKPMPYHYYFDFLVGIVNRYGVPIDLAMNGFSAIFLTILLYMIYKLPQLFFVKNRFLGLLSVLLFLFHSNWTFVDYFKAEGFSIQTLLNIWRVQDYIHAGPFDGSLVSIFFTLNVYLNQRHLIMAMAIGLGICYVLFNSIYTKKDLRFGVLIVIGIFLGLLSRVHGLVFFSMLGVVTMAILMFQKYKWIIPIFSPVTILFSFHLNDILRQDLSHPFWNPGFLAERPLTIFNFFWFWFLNLGVGFILIPLSLIGLNLIQKKIFFCFLILFIVGNLFQFGFRIDHNHSFFNMFVVIANMYIAYLLVRIYKKNIWLRIGSVICVVMLTMSGFIDMMVVKNDYQLRYDVEPRNALMQWIISNTNPNAIFVSYQEILDPTTLSGRKNYLGHSYYLTVMGYDYTSREKFIKSLYESPSNTLLEKAKKENIQYIVIPLKKPTDFVYKVDTDFFQRNLSVKYKNKDVIVFGI